MAQLQGGADCEAAIRYLRSNGVPAYATPEQAVTALAALRAHAALNDRNADAGVDRPLASLQPIYVPAPVAELGSVGK